MSTVVLAQAKVSDITEILKLEIKCKEEDLFSADVYNHYIRHIHRGAIVAKEDENIVGVILYRARTQDLEIIRLLAYRPEVAKILLARLKEPIKGRTKNYLSMATRESDLPRHLFLKDNGFRCVEVSTKFWDVPPENAYIFRWSR